MNGYRKKEKPARSNDRPSRLECRGLLGASFAVQAVHLFALRFVPRDERHASREDCWKRQKQSAYGRAVLLRDNARNERDGSPKEKSHNVFSDSDLAQLGDLEAYCHGQRSRKNHAAIAVPAHTASDTTEA